MFFPFPPQAGHQFLQLNYSGVTTLLEKSCLHNRFLRGDHSRVYTKCNISCIWVNACQSLLSGNSEVYQFMCLIEVLPNEWNFVNYGKYEDSCHKVTANSHHCICCKSVFIQWLKLLLINMQKCMKKQVCII